MQIINLTNCALPATKTDFSGYVFLNKKLVLVHPDRTNRRYRRRPKLRLLQAKTRHKKAMDEIATITGTPFDRVSKAVKDLSWATQKRSRGRFPQVALTVADGKVNAVITNKIKPPPLAKPANGTSLTTKSTRIITIPTRTAKGPFSPPSISPATPDSLISTTEMTFRHGLHHSETFPAYVTRIRKELSTIA